MFKQTKYNLKTNNINEIDLDYELAKQFEILDIGREQNNEENRYREFLDHELAKRIKREEIERVQKEEENRHREFLDRELAKRIEREEIERVQKEEENRHREFLDHELAKQLEREEEEEIFNQTKNCEICLEDFSLLDGTNYFLNCNCVLHNTCFDNMVKVAVENNNLPINCPNCKVLVNPNFIIDSIKNANPDLLEKYHKFSLNNFLMNNNDEYSNCPTPGCDYIFFFQQGEVNFLCPLCHKNYCLNCKDEWHNGLTCQQYQDSRDEQKLDNQFFEFVKGAKFKMCPKCKYWVEKTKGCNHMKCRCGTDFCYLCGDFMNMNDYHVCRK